MDIARFFQAHHLPILASVKAPVNAVPTIQTIPWVTFTGSHPQYRWIILLNGNSANRKNIFFVENRFPIDASACCFPETPRCRPRIHNVSVVANHIDRSNPSAHTARPNGTGLHAL